MKRVAIFVLAFIAIVVADNKDIEDLAKRYDSDPKIVETCLADVEITTEEIYALVEKWEDLKEDSFSDNMKESLEKYSVFLGCILEKNGMLVDSKLVVDKIMESIEKDKDGEKLVTKEAFKKCLNSLNEADMSQDERVFGLMLCAISGEN